MSSTSDRRRAASVAVVLSGWPRVSETFALNELLALRRAGLLAAVFATKAGDRTHCQPGVAELDPLVEILPVGTADEQAAVVAARLAGRGVTGIHGYVAHRPTAVAALAASRLGIPFGFSAHALDVRKVTAAELTARGGAAAVVIACNDDVAATLRTAGLAPRLVAHGVDLARFAPVDRPFTTASLQLLAVGRLVEKKGFDVLIEAMARTTAAVRLTIVGEGPERGRIVDAVRCAALGDRVTLHGSVTHDDLPAMYAAADVVVVPSRVDRRGDRDGLPNVVLEALASGRPVVASDVAAIATAVRDGRNGVLVPPDDPVALAAAIDALGADPVRRRRLGVRARADAAAHHGAAACGRDLVTVMERAYG